MQLTTKKSSHKKEWIGEKTNLQALFDSYPGVQSGEECN